MKSKQLYRLISMLLVLALAFGFAVPAAAVSAGIRPDSAPRGKTG